MTIGHGMPHGYVVLSFRPVEEQASIDEQPRVTQASRAVVRENDVEQTCSFGHRHVTHKIRWRTLYVPVLRLFSQHAGLTTAEVGEWFVGSAGATARKCTSELLHFGLLKIGGSDGGRTLYEITDAGEAFLRGTAPVPLWVWPKGVELPKECVPGPQRYLREVTIH